MGATTVTVVVTDSQQATATQSFTVSVTNTNDAPYFSSMPLVTTNEDAEYRYAVVVADDDINDALTLSLIGGPEGMSLDASNQTLTWTPEQDDVGQHTVTLHVQDQEGANAQQVFVLDVVNVNDAPQLAESQSVTVEATQPLNYQLHASDEDGDSIEYTLVSGPDGLTVSIDGLLSWTPTDTQQGTFTADIQVTDGTAISVGTITVEVTEPPYTEPVFVDNTTLVAPTGSPFTYQVQLQDADGVTFSLQSTQTNIQIDAATGEITWSQPEEGSYSLEVKASVKDTIFSVQTYNLTVVDAEPSHEGSDFWLAFGTNYISSYAGNLYLYVSSKTDTTGVVEVPTQNISINFTVAAGDVQRIDIPSDVVAYNGYSTAQDVGIHVSSDANVVLYALNQKDNSTDGFLVYPTDTLGYSYRAMTYDGGQIYFTATENDTTVEVTFAQRVYIQSEQAYREPGDTLSVTLQAGEVYILEANTSSGGSLTGSQISSDKPLAAFSGNYCVFVPTGKTACDHLVEQLPTEQNWGLQYFSVPLANRYGGDIFRIVAGHDNTRVVINGEFLTTINAGEYLEDTLDAPSTISANHPIEVAQFSRGYSTDYSENQTLGDPFMVMLTPVEQFVSHYQFTTTDQGIDYNYVNVVAKAASLPNLTLDGLSLDSNDFSTLSDGEYVYAQLGIEEGAHILKGDTPFLAYMYGFGETDSYGYQGGIKLPRILPGSALSLSLGWTNAMYYRDVCRREYSYHWCTY